MNDPLEKLKDIKPDYWRYLQESVGKMSADQISWTMAQPQVRQAYDKMQEAFTNYLFEKFKDDFVIIPSYRPFADSYIQTILDTSVNYVDKTTRREREQEETRKELEELKKNAN